MRIDRPREDGKPHSPIRHGARKAASWLPTVSGEVVSKIFPAILAGGIIILAMAAIKHGAVERTWADIMTALFSSDGDEDLRYYILQLRLPKVTAALAVGAALSVTGVILQNVLNNQLASSFTLGLSQGAAFGASFSMILLASVGSVWGLGIVTLGALAGALSAALLIMGFSLVRGMSPQGLILVGVALATFYSAATMSLQYFASDSQVAATVFWTFGDLSKGGWREALLVSGVSLAGLLMAVRHSLDYDALRWGDTQAQALGVAVRRLRFVSLFAASLMAAAATAFYGVIGFVGLVAPHMVRLLFPHAGHYYLTCVSALFGGFFLLAADLAAQSIMYPVLLPIGIICSFTGVPVFLFLLLRGAARHA